LCHMELIPLWCIGANASFGKVRDLIARKRPVASGRLGSKGAHRTKVTGVISRASQPQNWASAQVVAHANFVGWCFVDRRGPRIVGARASAYI
jgi:hypothetical protein